MAVSTASAFRPARKQSVSSANAPSFLDSAGPMPPPPTSSTASSSSSSAHPASSNGMISTSPSTAAPLSAASIASSMTLRSPADGGIGSSLISSNGASGAPIAANTIGNKPAVVGSSLYQACLSLRDRLNRVPGFGDAFLMPLSAEEGASPVLAQPESLSSPPSPKTMSTSTMMTMTGSDAVSELWKCFRMGAPLCWLMNQLGPATVLPISADPFRSNANECKKQVAKFIIALKAELGWDPDDIFTVSQLYLNDTNGFVKVIKTVSKLLDVFEERGLLTEASNTADADADEFGEKPSDERTWIVRELLSTERKYVQDLEVLQSYAKALAQNDIIPTDTIHNLFGNLNTLVDVQRRFLICVEENARRPADEQHFGHVFQTMESDFAVYEPFCANYAQALDIINTEAHNLTQLRGLPGSDGCYLDPSYELPTFLIKPVQRICKYPLLLEQLLKKSGEAAPNYAELSDGLVVIRRITDKVNETRRLQENIQLVRDLDTRVEDWKGHNIHTFGNLLLSDVFMVSKSESEREYHVYLFEKILLCCKEVLPSKEPKKGNKSNSLLKQKQSLQQQQMVTPTPPGKKPKTALQLKGRIFLNNVTGAFPATNNKAVSMLGAPTPMGQYALQVWWRGDLDQESFSLRCKNEEQLKQWQNAITRLIEDFNQRRQHMAVYYSQTGGISPGSINMAGAGANGRRNTASSLNHGPSMFPQTPLSEIAPAFPFTRTDSQSSHRGLTTAAAAASAAAAAAAAAAGEYESGNGGFDTPSGRGTPLGARYSQPAEQRERKVSLTASDTRPRARTEDQDGSLMSQWRSHSPAMQQVPSLPTNYPYGQQGPGGHPPLPRGFSSGSNMDLPGTSSSASSSASTQQIRKASSSRQLRQPGYAAIHGGGYPRPPRQPTLHSNNSNSGIDMSSSDIDSPTDQLEGLSFASRGNPSAAALHRGSETSAQAAAAAAQAQAAMHTRSRSASVSAMYANASPSSSTMGPPPPMPRGPHIHTSNLNEQSHTSQQQQQHRQGHSSHHHQQQQQQPSQHQQPHQQGQHDKRFSSSSISTLDSARSSHSRPGSTAASSPVTLSAGSSGGSVSSSAVKLNVTYEGERVVVVTLAQIAYVDLVEKISKKLRQVFGSSSSPSTIGGGGKDLQQLQQLTPQNLKIRYVDEDGDKVWMGNDDDVQMAFEAARNGGQEGVELIVVNASSSL